MHIAQITAFLTVADLQSFSRAAEKLHLTQPAVSKRIRQLEEEIGSKLIDRIGKNSLLTPDGHTFRPHAERILQELSDFRHNLSEQDEQPAGVLTLGTSHHIGLHRLPPVLRQYRKEFPRVDLDIEFMDSEDACAAVAANSLELAVVTLPQRKIENLQMETIWLDDLVVILAPDHPLAKQDQLAIDALVDYPAILPSEGTFTRKIINELFANRKELKIVLETNYLETIKVMVSADLGWSILPGNMADASVVTHQLQQQTPQRRLGIVTHEQRTLSSSSKAMIELLRMNRDEIEAQQQS